jgi:hypothetical protein
VLTDIRSDTEARLSLFFNAVFGTSDEGFVCVANRPLGGAFVEQYFHWPDERMSIIHFVENIAPGNDVWFCPQLFKSKRRNKANIVENVHALWADLDECPPQVLQVEPTLLIESSRGRFQALWCSDDDIPAKVAEDYSKRIAYFHAEDGCDKSGWDLTQLLRVPTTFNLKYQPEPLVRIAKTGPSFTKLEDTFRGYPMVEAAPNTEQPYPEEIPDSSEVLSKYDRNISPAAYVLLHREPKAQAWSTDLWQLEMLLFEAGLSAPEVLSVCMDAPCNKYERDGRTNYELWADVCKAEIEAAKKAKIVARIEAPQHKDLHPLLTDKEREKGKAATPKIVTEYLERAEKMTDAAPQYHQAGIFVLLSGLLAGALELNVEYGTIVPNLWFMILADTTLTRKTTAMDIAMDMLAEIDDNAVLATDSSLEGMFAALSDRSGRPSIFLRDEFSGLIEMMAKRDYYAGMLETFAKLYDGKFQKKVLRRETLEIRQPIFILFAGGIKSRLMQLLTAHHIDSGFLPRFVFVSAEADLSRLRPIAPRAVVTTSGRQELIEQLRELHEHYNQDLLINIAGVAGTAKKKFPIELSEDAWRRLQIFEAQLNQDAADMDNPTFSVPMFARLLVSGIKASMLLAAAREKAEQVTVTLDDLLCAFTFVEQWRAAAVEIIENVGRTEFEVKINRTMDLIKAEGGACPRSHVMRILRLTTKQADDLVSTMHQRGMIEVRVTGKHQHLIGLEQQ